MKKNNECFIMIIIKIRNNDCLMIIKIIKLMMAPDAHDAWQIIINKTSYQVTTQ